MAKKDKEIVYFKDGIEPGLFGQKYSSRDYRFESAWGKNMFNSSFPASLVAYMHSKGIDPVFIRTDENNKIVHFPIPSAELLGIDHSAKMHTTITRQGISLMSNTTQLTQRKKLT